MPEIGSATMSILPGACLLAVLGCQGSPRAVMDPAGPRGALDSTRLLATTDPIAARAWTEWRRAHPAADMTTLSTELDEGTLESSPFDSPFFATGQMPVLGAAGTATSARPPHLRHTRRVDPRHRAADSTRTGIQRTGADRLGRGRFDAYLVEVNGAGRISPTAGR